MDRVEGPAHDADSDRRVGHARSTRPTHAAGRRRHQRPSGERAAQVVGGVEHRPSQDRGAGPSRASQRGRRHGRRVHGVAGVGGERYRRQHLAPSATRRQGRSRRSSAARTARSAACSGCQKPSAAATSSRLDSRRVRHRSVARRASLAAGSGQRRAAAAAASLRPLGARGLARPRRRSRSSPAAPSTASRPASPAQVGVDESSPGRHRGRPATPSVGTSLRPGGRDEPAGRGELQAAAVGGVEHAAGRRRPAPPVADAAPAGGR